MKIDNDTKTIIFDNEDDDWVIVIFDNKSKDYIPIKVKYTHKVFGVELFKGFKENIKLNNLRVFFEEGKYTEVDYLAIWKMKKKYLRKYSGD